MADQPFDLDAIEQRYFGDDAQRYYTGKTPREDIRALVAEVRYLAAHLHSANGSAATAWEQLDAANATIAQHIHHTTRLQAAVDSAGAEIAAAVAARDEALADVEQVIQERDRLTAKFLAELDEAQAVLEMVRRERNQALAELGNCVQGELGWQYGFVNAKTGEFVVFGSEHEARAFAPHANRPLMRRRATFGPREPVTEEQP